jgi:hypothetical protein
MMKRDLESCGSGDLVESINGDQLQRAIYTILPPQGLGNL